jgi:hypothetical protein
MVKLRRRSEDYLAGAPEWIGAAACGEKRGVCMTVNSPAESAPVGEIVAASLTGFTAEVHRDRLYETPPFGSVVKTTAGETGEWIFGVVAEAETGSLEPGRRATAFWQTEQALRDSQPQIFELLATSFTVLALACSENGALRLRLPPAPPRIHAFVYACSADEIRRLTAAAGLVDSLVSAPVDRPDELVAAVLRQGALTQPDSGQFFVSAGKRLASLLPNDYARLQSILRKLD